MSRSFLHRVSNALLPLMSITFLVVSVGVHSENDMLTIDDYLLDVHETNQRMLNALWLEQGMEEVPRYSENNDALKELTKGLLKKSWAALVSNNPRYDQYTPVVSGHFAARDSNASYDVKLSGSIIKLSVDYSF